MLTDTVMKQLKEAMKAKDEVKVLTLRLLSSELKNARIQKREDLTEEEELKVVQREAKKRKDAIKAYEKAGASEKADREKEELNVLSGYLPKPISDEELEKMVDEAMEKTGASQVSDIGKVMGVVMAGTKGNADGKRVAELVKNRLG